jgi:hypothetical protein
MRIGRKLMKFRGVDSAKHMSSDEKESRIMLEREKKWITRLSSKSSGDYFSDSDMADVKGRLNQ